MNLNNARIIHRPPFPLKKGKLVTVEIEPGYVFQSHITDFFGTRIMLDGWKHPVNMESIRTHEGIMA